MTLGQMIGFVAGAGLADHTMHPKGVANRLFVLGVGASSGLVLATLVSEAYAPSAAPTLGSPAPKPLTPA